VIDVRRRWSNVKGFTRRLGEETRSRFGVRSPGERNAGEPSSAAPFVADPFEDDATRVWRGDDRSSDGNGRRRRSGNADDWDMVAMSDEEADDVSAYPVYFHHPDRRSATFFNQRPPASDDGDEDAREIAGEIAGEARGGDDAREGDTANVLSAGF
jgi:hypothetical protein